MAKTDDAKAERSLRRTQENFERVRALLDTPMTILALLLGLVLLAPVFFSVTETTERNLDLTSWFIWAAFVAEYLVLLWTAPSRKDMMRTHKLDLFLIVVPFFRPLRLLRLLNVFASFGAVVVMGNRIMQRRGLQWILVAVGAVIVLGAFLTMLAERQDPTASIDSFGTALWWAVVTSTTVGYGDVSPVTPGGQGIAVVLMLVGIALLSVITANIASLFVESDLEDENDELRDQLIEVNAKLDQLLSASVTS